MTEEERKARIALEDECMDDAFVDMKTIRLRIPPDSPAREELERMYTTNRVKFDAQYQHLADEHNAKVKVALGERAEQVSGPDGGSEKSIELLRDLDERYGDAVEGCVEQGGAAGSA